MVEGMGYLAQKIAKMFRTAFLSISILLFSCSDEHHLPYYNTPDFSPQFISQKLASKEIKHQIKDFSFTDQNNKTISQREVEGKIHVANFFFTNCGLICPKMTNNLKLVQKEFANDAHVAILSFSVTPWIDDVAKLNDYANLNEITSPYWHLLTGNKSSIYQLARQSYFAEEELGFTKDSTEFLHTEHFLLVDKTKRIRGIYNGTLELDVRQLIDDIKILKKEL
jgi:protein SCO1/2